MAAAHRARDHGCGVPAVLCGRRFASAVRGARADRRATVISDGPGRAAGDENFDALAFCGHWISYGQASGPIAPVDPALLATKSATLSRPVLFHYTADRHTLEAMAQAVFAAIAKGTLRAAAGHRYPLSAAAEAHRALEARETSGPIVLVP